MQTWDYAALQDCPAEVVEAVLELWQEDAEEHNAKHGRDSGRA